MKDFAFRKLCDTRSALTMTAQGVTEFATVNVVAAITLTQAVEPSTDPSTFYRNEPTNLYNKVIHEQMVDGKAYAFAFDDVANQESLVMALLLQSFKQL